jgi:Xaa-Pro aminopeptidase
VHRALLFLLLTLNISAALNPDFAERRAKWRKDNPDGILVLFGAKESEDLHYGFFQEPNFYYFTGWEEPGAILVLTPDPDKDEPAFQERTGRPREILFLPQRVPGQEKWTGRKLGPSDANAAVLTGFSKVLPAERFESELRALLDLYQTTYALPADASRVTALAPLRTPLDAVKEIAKLRMEKSAFEISAIQRATDASIDSHRAAWNILKPGLYEYELAATMTAAYMREGCRRPAYAPIVGSGPNSTVLHYSRNSRRMDEGEIVVMDVAAECGNYSSDITRTVPANGRFTPRQREIYRIVLAAQQAAIAAIKPGMTIGKKTPNTIYQVAFDYINTHGKDLHGEALGKYFTHGLSHHVGLDVHDESDNHEPLKAGMVITVEPGIYIPEENIGVRIEDVVLVTEKGAKILSAALPTDPDELERALARHK